MSVMHKIVFHALRLGGMPLGRLRTRGPFQLIYERLGRKAYPRPDTFSWSRNRWGHEFHLSYSYHIDRQILIYGTYDRPLHNIIDRIIKPGMICMDVGANLGEMTLHMANKVTPGGAVYSFEPVPHVYQRLITHIIRNGLDDRVYPFDLALSNANGPVDLAFTDEDADNQALGSIVNTCRDGLNRRLQVKGCTLDSFVAQHHIARIDLMKIDIQGAEWFLLEGGSRVFSDMAPDLLIEISPLDLNEIGKNSRQLAELIESFGYRIYTLNADGTPGCRLLASSLDTDFSASNVLCTRNCFS
jgi:FkbM family methyltransferase